MKTALLIADLEGVAGVDHLDAIAFGSKRYPDACAKLTAEVLAAIEGLRAQGFTHVRVSDSHRSGRDAPNVDAAALPAGCELRFESFDPYGGALLEGVSAMACVGMHAAGGTQGFAAHTVQAGVEWRLGGHRVSETHLAVWRAAEHGIPAIFCAGDDVLGASLAGLVPFVKTKVALGVAGARSVKDARAAIRAAAAVPPGPVAAVPPGALTVAVMRGARQTWDGPSFGARYLAALAGLPEVEVGPSEVPGTAGFVKWSVRQIEETARAFTGP